jgi:hypothetical protein
MQLVLVGLVGCVSTPRSSSELQRRTDPLEFSGVFEVPGVELAIQAKNQRTQAWVTFASATTRSEDPVVGVSGSPYFRYSKRVAVPQDSDYWTPHRDSGRIEAQVRVVRGERVLPVFDADAEGCLRRAQAHAESELAAVTSCASGQGGVARVLVASCGGLGEPCCPQPTAANRCGPDYTCGGTGLCEQPRYPVPLVAGVQVDLPLGSGFGLRDAWLVMDDRASGPKSVRPLIEHFSALAGVAREQPHPNVVRLRFDVGFWKPGTNRFAVHGISVSGDKRRPVASEPVALEYSVPRTLGLAMPGRLDLPAEHFPRLVSDCHGPTCNDADADGLNDLWENVAVQQLRPRLMLDEQDGLVAARNAAAVRVLSSVLPIEHKGRSYVLFANVITSKRDYGHMGLLAHAGDTEAFGMLYRVNDAGGLTWVSSATKGHACLTCGPKYNFLDQEFAQDGTPTLYVERDKHGLWPSGKSCRERAAFSCGGQRVLRPVALNVGDPSADGSRALVDNMDGLAANGSFASLAGLFPGEAVWTRALARVPGRFCGGRLRCSAGASANQPGNVIADLLALFERRIEEREGVTAGGDGPGVTASATTSP